MYDHHSLQKWKEDQLMYMMESTYQAAAVHLTWCMSSSHEGVDIFFHIKDILCGCIHVSRQLSLISNALFLTFTTMCHYQKGLDFSEMTFRPWVRYTVSTLQDAYGEQYLFFLYGNVKKTQSKRHKHFFFIFFLTFYRCSTWRVLWDFGFALSVETNFSEIQSCVDWFFAN